MDGLETLSGDYLNLIRRRPLRPIRDDHDYEEAVAMVREYRRSPRQLGGKDDEENAYFAVLETLLSSYEKGHFPKPETHLRDKLWDLLTTRNITFQMLAAIAGMAPSELARAATDNDVLSPMADYKLCQCFNLPHGHFRYDIRED
ncbi:MAG: hypothetical protein AAGD32_02930 [Planctomycetota bacterium]